MILLANNNSGDEIIDISETGNIRKILFFAVMFILYKPREQLKVEGLVWGIGVAVIGSVPDFFFFLSFLYRPTY